MRNFRLALLLLVVIAGTTNLAPIAADAASSSAVITCTKLNSIKTVSGVKYQCVKSGSKLILKKIATTASYYIPPRPKSSNPITFANITSRVNDIPRAVFDSLQETKARNASLPGAKIQVNIIRGPHVIGSYFDNSEKWFKAEVAALANFARFKKFYIFEYGFEDVAWMQTKMDEVLNDTQVKADRIYGGKSCEQANRVAPPNNANITNGWDIKVDKSKPLEMEIPFVLAGYCPTTQLEQWDQQQGPTHELAHQYEVVQYWDAATNIYPKSLTNQPCWIGEGLAVAAGSYSFETNYDQYLADLKKLPRPYYLNSSQTSSYEAAPMYWGPEHVQNYLQDASTNLPGCRSNNRYALSYSLGSYMFMALSAIGGWESVWSMLPMLHDDSSLNNAFKRVYGISWDAALPILSKVVSEMVMNNLDPKSSAAYRASDPTNVVSLTGVQGCSAYVATNSQTVRARIQVFQNNEWLDVPTIEQSWAYDPVQCFGMPAKMSWVVTLKVALDHGAAYRFLYLGDVNIGNRDSSGRGYSQTYILP